jgi:CheY-like chemotaxis protein/AraC-like DNA-binding protein
MLTSEQFLRHLRDVLNHLYDPDRLRSSPLAACFDVADRFDTPSALQRVLIDAIEMLKPEPAESSQSPTWKIYNLLFCRYVQQFSQQEVADQLGISVRHLRREQRAALEALACQLWEQFHLEEKLCESTDVENASVQAVATGPAVNEELAWLRDALPERPVDLNKVLPAVLDLVQPLAARYGVRLRTATSSMLPNLAVHPVALRQILLNLISMAIHQASSGRRGSSAHLDISAGLLRWEVCLRMQCARSCSRDVPAMNDEATSQDMTYRMVDLCGGKLVLSSDEEEAFVATLTLPAVEQLPVLVVDDNADTLQLLQRYASGTRYRVVGTRDPEQALSLAAKFSVQIIVLDVMMPQADGWEILGRLRQHPLTERAPIVVCTILAQEELALSLGASSFIRKPVTRRIFLAALDRQVERMEPALR